MSPLYIYPFSKWSERFDLETIDSFDRYWRRRRSPGCTAGDDPDLVLECSVFTRSLADGIPEDAREHDGQDGYEWVVAAIDVKAGELDGRTNSYTITDGG